MAQVPRIHEALPDLPHRPTTADRFRIVDHVVELRTEIAAVRLVLIHLLAPFTWKGPEAPSTIYELREVERPPDRRRFELLREGEIVGRVSSIGLLVDLFVRETTNQIVSATGYVAIHAAAAARGGRAVIMPAPPGGGKTTTVSELVRRGWDFLTDEAVLISTADGLVHPFPRPLSISPGSLRLLPGLEERIDAPSVSYRHYDRHVAPDDLRPGCVSGPVPIASIVFLGYAPGADTWLVPIPRAEARVDLLKATFNLEDLGRRGVEVLAPIVDRVPCSRLAIGGLAPAVHEIERSFGSPAIGEGRRR